MAKVVRDAAVNWKVASKLISCLQNYCITESLPWHWRYSRISNSWKGRFNDTQEVLVFYRTNKTWVKWMLLHCQRLGCFRKCCSLIGLSHVHHEYAVVKFAYEQVAHQAGAYPGFCSASYPLVRGAVASWLESASPDWVVQVWALARDSVLCSWARHLTLLARLSSHVFKDNKADGHCYTLPEFNDLGHWVTATFLCRKNQYGK